MFSKDWKNFKTQIYLIPKKPGSYSLNPIADFDVNSLITGADYDEVSKNLVLTATEFTDDNNRKQYLFDNLRDSIFNNSVNGIDYEVYY